MQKVKIKISGMHCSSCSLRIDGDLEELYGVKSSSTYFAAGISEIEYDETLANTKQFKEVIEKAGYKVISEE